MITLLLLSVAGQAQPRTANDWLSLGHEQQRSGRNTAETPGRGTGKVFLVSDDAHVYAFGVKR